jgi:hypothetical protein
MLFDLSIALRLRHDVSKVAAPTPHSGACETWVPLRPHRPGSQPSPTSGSDLPEDPLTCYWPNWPSWRPTRPPEDLPEDSPNDLIQHNLKTLHTRQDISGFRLSRSTGYGKCCNINLGHLVVTDQVSGNQPHLLANIRRTRRPLVTYTILKQSTPTTGRRVLLSGDPNQYKLAVFYVFCVLVCNLRVVSLTFHPAEQLNDWD